MSQSQQFATPAHHSADARSTVVATDDDVTDLLDLFEDADCRVILEATGEEALSASEIVEVCEVPQSTAYRKLNQLADAGLLEERIRPRSSGKHTREYARNFEDVAISLGGDGIVLRVSERENDSAS